MASQAPHLIFKEGFVIELAFGDLSLNLVEKDWSGKAPKEVTGAESVDNCYGPCSQIPYPSDCPIFCVEKGYRGGFCMPQLIIRRVRPDPTCCCFGK